MTIKEGLLEFIGNGCDIKLTKTGSKKTSSAVDVGQMVEGDASLLVSEDSNGTELVQIVVIEPSIMSCFVRTSPIVKIIKTTKKSMKVETAGGFYSLEKL